MNETALLNRLEKYLKRISEIKYATLEYLSFLKKIDTISLDLFKNDLKILNISMNEGIIDSLLFEKSIRVYIDKIINYRDDVDFGIDYLFSPKGINNLIEERNFTTVLDEVLLKEKSYDYIIKNPIFYLSCLKDLNDSITPYKHQIENIKNAVFKNHGICLLLDEVGIGKTLTGLLIFFELFNLKLASSLLILSPSNLVEEVWNKEFNKYFNDKYKINILNKENIGLFNLGSKGQRFIISNHNSIREPFNNLLLKENWDCVIIDESHHIRNDDIKLTKLCYSLKAIFKILLTATPVHNNGLDIFNQINLLKPGILGTRTEFKDLHIGYDGLIKSPEILRERIENTKIRTRRTDTNLNFPKRIPKLFKIYKRSNQEKEIYQKILKIIQGPYKRSYPGVLELIKPRRKATVSTFILQAILVLKELASHPISAIKTIDTKLRCEVDKITDITGNKSDLEIIDDLVNKFGDPDIWKLGSHSKTDKLVELIPDFINKSGEKPSKIIIYTEYIPSQMILKKLINEAKMVNNTNSYDLHIFNGNIDRREKNRILNIFNMTENNAILLSTDCGGEGLNLQVANTVINYDFPWNPMRIEQRIGRIDRSYKNRKKIYVYNFLTKGTIEDYIYAILNKKLEIFGQIMGEFVPPITPSKLKRVFDYSIGYIIATSKNETEMSEKLSKFREEILSDSIESIKKKEYWRIGGEYK